MNAELKSKWTAALRSGEFEQTTGILQGFSENDLTKKAFCCLGVLCKIAYPNIGNVNNITIDNNTEPGSGSMGYKKIDGLVGSADLVDTLVNLNDSMRKSFTEIADYIDENLIVDTVEVA